MSSSSLLKKLTKLIKKCDYFGVQFNFHYKTHSKFHTVTGGFIFIIFILVGITYIALNIQSFLKRQNMHLIYYTKKNAQTDLIKFENYSIAYAYGVVCDGLSSEYSIYDYIKLNLNFIVLNKTGGGYNKTVYPIDGDYCTEADFYNEFNSSFLSNSLSQYLCPKEKNFIIGGLYTDEIFNYYEFVLSFKFQNETLFEELKDILQNYECRYEVFHIDTTINVYDYKNPVRRYITSEFTVLKPDEFMKMNIFFKTIFFDSDENYLFNHHKKQYFLGFSSYELYSSKKGYDRITKKISNYDKLAKIYFRSGLEHTIIQRNYMKLTEFAANMSSLLSTILLILYVIVTYMNTFFAEQSVMKKIFQFKGDQIKKSQHLIRELKSKFFSYKNDISKYSEQNSKKKNNFNSNKLFQKKITSDNSSNLINNSHHSSLLNIVNINQKTTISPNIQELNSSNFQQFKRNLKQLYLKSNEDLLVHLSKNRYYFSPINKKLNYQSQGNLLDLYDKKKKRIDNIYINYNLIELLIVFFCPCCAWRKLRKKNALLHKGKEKFFLEVDILSYLRRMQQLELLNYVLLEPEESNMLYFLSKPSLSLANQIEIFHNIILKNHVNVSKSEIDDFAEYFMHLMNKKNKTKVEKRLFKIANVQLYNLFKKK